MSKAVWWSVAGFFIPICLGMNPGMALVICLATAAISTIGG